MGKRKNILLLTSLLFVLVAVLVYLIIRRGRADDMPVKQEMKPETTVQTDTTTVTMDDKPAEVMMSPKILKPKIDSIHPVKKIVVAPDIRITEEMMGELERLGEELVAASQKEVIRIDSAAWMVPLQALPPVSQYAFLTTRRVASSVLFVPKGQWFFGGTITYTDHSNSNYKLLVLEDWQGAGYTITGRMYLGYAIKDNLGIGVKAGFERARIHIDKANLNLGDDLSFGVNNVRYINQQWSGTVFMRNFLSLFKSRQFGLFNDLELTFGGGTSKMVSGTGDAVKGTYESVFKTSIGISPGIMVFMHNIAAIEVSVGVLGFSTTSRKQITNQVYEGSRRNTGAQFGVDLLSIKLGGTIYLNSRRFKQR